MCGHTGAALWALQQWHKRQIQRVEQEAAKPLVADTVLRQRVMNKFMDYCCVYQTQQQAADQEAATTFVEMTRVAQLSS
jgi:hypothetical protein